jgi:hypothetical protein
MTPSAGPLMASRVFSTMGPISGIGIQSTSYPEANRKNTGIRSSDERVGPFKITSSVLVELTAY